MAGTSQLTSLNNIGQNIAWNLDFLGLSYVLTSLTRYQGFEITTILPSGECQLTNEQNQAYSLLRTKKMKNMLCEH